MRLRVEIDNYSKLQFPSVSHFHTSVTHSYTSVSFNFLTCLHLPYLIQIRIEMNPRYLLFITFLLLQTQAFAQATIQGKILDEKGLPLPGANIQIKGSFDGATSEADGSFQFESESLGAQMLLFKFLGFKTQELVITLSSGTNEISPIKLVEEITEMNSVTISAGAMEASDASGH